MGEDWRLSRWLNIDFGNSEGVRLWYANERAVARTIQCLKDDVVMSLRSVCGEDAQPRSFRSTEKAENMAGLYFQHFMLVPREFERASLDRGSGELPSTAMLGGYHVSQDAAYTGVFDCPEKGERSKTEALDVLEQVGLRGHWRRVPVMYDSGRRDPNGNVVRWFSSVPVLSVSVQDDGDAHGHPGPRGRDGRRTKQEPKKKARGHRSVGKWVPKNSQ
eukprot:CAMPEP_0179022938 /NCGR_PEP_ID=MMETSP0796-20121207/6672_1 /TAXON_ID=73915 /ORGANISM="Pyrodinium bahamense, Strain pbaha01" /LENGTH=217 /DNA_ID=CAMNT_0020718833 /DNA_START=39 /DNA_END=692 /DNA_ORIENTATION=-